MYKCSVPKCFKPVSYISDDNIGLCLNHYHTQKSSIMAILDERNPHQAGTRTHYRYKPFKTRAR